MHLHVSAVDALATFLKVLIVGFLWRMLAFRLAANGSPWGEAALTLY
jgi:hypothetical protein